MNKAEKRIRDRYFRPVIAHPEGAIVHHGDCGRYNFTRICTCGLHHDLQPMDPELREKLYPKFWDEWGIGQEAEQVMLLVDQGEIYEKCDKCKGEGPSFDSFVGGASQDICEKCKGMGFVPYVPYYKRPKPKCPMCGKGEMEPHIDFPEKVTKAWGLVDLIPCKKCNKCGEKTYDAKTIDRIEEARKEEHEE